MSGIKFDFVSMGIGELLKKGRLEVPPNRSDPTLGRSGTYRTC